MKGRIGDVHITDVETDAQLVFLVDELKYRLKTGIPYSPMRKDFNELLNQFIEKHGLGWDQHSFARLPENAR